MLTRPLVLSCVLVLIGSLAAAPSPGAAAEPAKVEPLAGTRPLTWEGDLSLKMVDDLHLFADRLTAESVERRARHWKRDFSSREAYEKSIEPNRKRLAKYLGVGTEAPEWEDTLDDLDAKIVEGKDGKTYQIGVCSAIRDNGVQSIAIVVTPHLGEDDSKKRAPHGSFRDIMPTVVVIPDSEQSPPEIVGLIAGRQPQSTIVSRLAGRGYRVVVPYLTNRRHDHSQVAQGARLTKQPHREFIYRQAFEMGRHVIGYDVDTVRSWITALPWLINAESRARHEGPVGVFGMGEGGLVALYAGAVDPRIDVVGVSGYFGPREKLFDEPIYRNVWGILDEFGDAELATLIAPRKLIVEAAAVPNVDVPAAERDGKPGPTPGSIANVPVEAAANELARAERLVESGDTAWKFATLVKSGAGDGAAGGDEAIETLARTLTPKARFEQALPTAIWSLDEKHDESASQKMLVAVQTERTQALVYESEYVRKGYWANADRKSRDPAKWAATLEPYRKHLYEEVLGRFDLPKLPPNARTRKIYDTPKYVGYEVVLDVFGAKPGDGNLSTGGSDVWAFGILLVPKDLKPGEKRPVVVCQHGLEGRPEDTIRGDVPGSRFYHEFAAKLADRGFVAFSPQNPYIGKTHFRQLVRKLYPLKKTLWSVIVPQHEQITDWLAGLEFVDPQRIGFYGLSYGGKTAMRVPALVERYCLSICSGDFNEWIRKCTSVRDTYSYMQTHEYEMYEFDLGHTFNYAEMAYLIAPRPFMVERGHRDGVGVDEWVSYEFAKVRMLYADLKIPERTEIEYFDGPHEIHAVGTFDFLHRHLNWPVPKE
jgi:dienelactone hydrolase